MPVAMYAQVPSTGADARLADAEQRDQRLVAGKDAELALDAGQDDHGDVLVSTPRRPE